MKFGIYGLGYVGSGIGVDLRSSLTQSDRIIGYDGDVRRRTQATALGAVHEATDDADGLSGASMVFVATESLHLEAALRHLTPHLATGVVVSHVGPVAMPGLTLARTLLPTTVAYVGSHLVDPAGVKGYQDDGRPVWCLIPGPNATADALALLSDVAKATGRRPLILDAGEHDAYVAGTHHMPALIRGAMLALITGSDGWRDLIPFAGPVRSAPTATPSPDDIIANRVNVVEWIDRFQQSLGELATLLAESDLEAIKEFLAQLEQNEARLLPDDLPADDLRLGRRVAESLLGRGIGRLWDRRGTGA